MRFIELPFQLSPGGAFALAALVSRNDGMQVGHTVWLGDGYDFSGGTPPASYQLLATVSRFAQRGTVLSDYAAETDTLDFSNTLRVILDAPDNQLDTQTGNNGLANELLVFIGDEIMSVVGWSLVAGGAYTLQVARGRFGTTRAAHVAGDEVFVIHKAALLPLTHASFQPGVEVSLKVAINSGAFTEDLDDVDATVFAITGAGLTPSPSNLRINDELRNATFVADADVKIDWSLPDLRTAISDGLGLRVRTLLEIVGAGDVVLWSKLTYQPHMKILGAKMTTILGAETEFDVRLTTDILGPEFHLVSDPVTLHAIQS